MRCENNFEIFKWKLNNPLIFDYSENIERHRKIIQQRIVAVKEEANRKYGNLLESIPLRLKQIVEKKQQEVNDEDKAEDKQEDEEEDDDEQN